MAESESRVAAAKLQSAVRSRAAGESRPDSAETKAGGPAGAAPRATARGGNPTRVIPDAKPMDDARRLAEDEEEARTNAEIDALAKEEARVAALVRERAERRATAKAETERRAAEQNRLAAASIGIARMDAGNHPTDRTGHLPHPPDEAAETTPIRETRTIENATETSGSPLLKITWLPRSSTRPVWHYTSEGDRLGPVSFDELKKRAAASRLDPRLDMVWKKGMDEWTPAGRIDGLFERLDPQSKTRQLLAKPTVPLQPTQRISQSKSRMKLSWPGTRRRGLLVATLVFPVAWKITLVAISPYLTKQFGIILMAELLPLAALVPLAVVIHFGLKRLMNLGMSRWWLLAACIPGLNLWLGYRCFACPPGFACHKKLDGPGIALAAGYCTAMAAAIWMLVFKPAKLLDLIDSPLLQKQLRPTTLKP